jgi:anti-sigma regulatory factor (Ser/Thr protein kinase)
MSKLRENGEAFFELSFSPNATLVSTVRRFVTEFYVQVLGDEEITSRLAVATHELLDNAVRYSIDGHSSIRLAVAPEGSMLNVTIDTRNRTTEANVQTIRTSIDEMMAASDPASHYQMLMRRSAKRTDGSGLGLGRIRAETDMGMSYRVEGDMLHIRAEARFDTKVPT